METKLLEIRDSATFIPVLAIKLSPTCEEERYLLARTGYGRTADQQSEYIVLFKLAGGVGRASSDPHQWGDTTTMPIAHQRIIDFWGNLKTGDVVDVEFILGKKSESKLSERVTG